jgi:alpha-ketoglutarate-dependent taurine dioxygenase
MRPRNRIAEHAFDLVDEAATRSGVLKIQWHPGLLLVLDNWRMLHARANATGRDEARALERVVVRS